MNAVVETRQFEIAPVKRAGVAEIAAAHELLASTSVVEQLLNSFPEAAVVLNAHRQIVFVNDKLAALLNRKPDRFLGSRPGEVLNCIHAHENAGGCGTTK